MDRELETSDRWCLRMTTRDELPLPASDSGEWVNLRDDAGRVQARYHPVLALLIIQDRGKKTIHDLNRHRCLDSTLPAAVSQGA